MNAKRIFALVAGLLAICMLLLLAHFLGRFSGRYETTTREEEVDSNISEYTSKTNLLDRASIIPSLRTSGDSRVLAVFLNTLTNEYHGQTLTEKEMDIMKHITGSIGVLARRDIAAYRFLVTEGVSPQFWSAHVPWRREMDSAAAPEELAGKCIGMIGSSCRSDVLAVLENLKQRHENGYNRRFSGSIIQAAFYHSMIEKYSSLDAAVEAVLDDPHTSFAAFIEWRSSEEGRPWAEWSDAVNRRTSSTR